MSHSSYGTVDVSKVTLQPNARRCKHGVRHTIVQHHSSRHVVRKSSPPAVSRHRHILPRGFWQRKDYQTSSFMTTRSLFPRLSRSNTFSFHPPTHGAQHVAQEVERHPPLRSSRATWPMNPSYHLCGVSKPSHASLKKLCFGSCLDVFYMSWRVMLTAT